MRPRDHFEMRRNWVNAMQILPGSRQWRMQKRGERERQARRVLKGGLNEVMCPRMKFVCCCWGTALCSKCRKRLTNSCSCCLIEHWVGPQTHTQPYPPTHTHRERQTQKSNAVYCCVGVFMEQLFCFCLSITIDFRLGLSLCISYCVCLCVCVPVFVVYLLCFCLPKCQIEFAASEPSSGARTSW